MFSDDLPWTNTSYDRDYDEEAANAALMTEDPNELDTSEEPATVFAAVHVAALNDDGPGEDYCRPHCKDCPHCAGCGHPVNGSGPYGCICDDMDDPQPGAYCDERCGNCGEC